MSSTLAWKIPWMEEPGGLLSMGLHRVRHDWRISNQPILKEIDPKHSLEVLTLKLKLQYFGRLMWRANSLEKTLCWERLKTEGEAGDGGWDGWMASLTQWTWTCANSKRWWETEKPGVRQSMGSQTIRHNLAAEQSRTTDWTTINMNHCNCVFSFTTLNKAQTNRQMSSSSICGLSGITLYSHGPCRIKKNWILMSIHGV